MSFKGQVILKNEVFDYEYYVMCCKYNDVNTLRQHEDLVRKCLERDQTYKSNYMTDYEYTKTCSVGYSYSGIGISEIRITRHNPTLALKPILVKSINRYHGIYTAITNGSVEVLEYLVTLGWNYNDTQNCLSNCCDIKTLEFILSLPNFNVNLNWFTSLLFYRCLILEFESIINLMLSKGFNVNNTNECGDNLLHHAYRNFHRGSGNIIKRLKKLGVNNKALNNEGKLPIQCKKITVDK